MWRLFKRNSNSTRLFRNHNSFVAFDIMKGNDRETYHNFIRRVLPFQFVIPRLIHIGQSYKIDKAKKAIEFGGHGNIDPVEGVVYRCERNNRVDFLCKWVRPDKIDGKYLPEFNNGIPYFNANFEKYINFS